jgi:glycosyltransferase involved in cell wall biosynthesis
MIRIADIPQRFLPEMPVQYPPHQGFSPMIEERAYSFFKTKQELESDYIYIPIQWTSWHVNPGGEYGQNTQPLIDYCNQLTEKHTNEKFFTVVQYDGGTLVPINNCTIFASSGNFSSPLGKNSVYEPIPLLCDPHDGVPNKVREYKVGYAGRDTHPLRVEMNRILSHLPQYKFASNIDHNKTEVFRDILYNSVFALSPRGFGPASFRMYEAIQMQCVPIYISDEFWLPFTEYIEWDKMCLLVQPNDIESIPQKVDKLLESGQYQDMVDYGQEMYEKHLTWDGCLNTIAKMVC